MAITITTKLLPPNNHDTKTNSTTTTTMTSISHFYFGYADKFPTCARTLIFGAPIGVSIAATLFWPTTNRQPPPIGQEIEHHHHLYSIAVVSLSLQHVVVSCLRPHNAISSNNDPYKITSAHLHLHCSLLIVDVSAILLQGNPHILLLSGCLPLSAFTTTINMFLQCAMRSLPSSPT